jgi:hypothetical protein
MSSKQEKTEKIQVLLSRSDLNDLSKRIAKESITSGEPPVSVSHYVRKLIRRNLGKASGAGE